MEFAVLEAVPVEIDRVLRNWGAWCYEAIQGASRCQSIEHRYLAANGDKAPSRLEVDIFDAALVEGVMRFLPEKDRQLLIGHYVHRFGWGTLTRRLSIPFRRESFDAALRKAALMAWNRYEVVAKRKFSKL